MSVGTCFEVAHPENSDVIVTFTNGDGLVNYCKYIGLAGYLPTEAIFEKGCTLVHKTEAKMYINQGNDGATPSFVEVPNQ